MLRDWGRLLRLSLLPSAAADVAAGWTLGALGHWPGGAQPFLLILASLGVYHGNLALNDWADRAHDARTRPERPIPSGAIPARTALAAALGLQLAGVGLALAVRWELGLWMAVVSALAASYDLVGRGPWLGPVLLGLCRAGNLGAGILGGALTAEVPVSIATGAAAAGLYGGYVFFVSRLGRLEDGEDDEPLGNRPSALILALAAVLLGLPALAFLDKRFDPAHPGPWALVPWILVLWASVDLVRRAHRHRGRWTRPDVLGAMGAALRRLLVVTASIALVAGSAGPAGPWVAAGILAGYPLAYSLRRAFPPS